MIARTQVRQRGQVLVVFAGGLVALLVVASMVIDLGFVFMLRRAEQNAADPGAVAAARYIRAGTYSDMVSAACFYAQQNGFFSMAPNYPTNTGCVPANDPNATTLTVNWPPSSAAGEFAGDAGKVEVIIGRQQQAFLAGIIGITKFGVASSAVAAFDDGNSNSSSLIALDPGGCSGSASGLITGGGSVEIDPVTPGADGGYVHVNSSCGTATGDDLCMNSSGGLKIDGGSHLTAPKTYVVGACSLNGAGSSLNSTLDEGSVILGDPLAELPPPSFGPPGASCGDSAQGDPTPIVQTTPTGAEGCDFKKKDQTYHLKPGVYYGGWKVTGQNVTLHLNPGIYIIAGGGVSVGSTGTITSVAGASGPAPVLVFSTDDPQYAAACKSGSGSGNQCQDNLNFTANSDLLLHGMDSGPYRGILMWQDGNGSGVTAGPKLDINLSGQTSLSLSGTIYDPRGVVTLDGGSIADGYAAVQIISWRWKIAGSGTLHMPYDPNQLYHFTSKGLVH